MSLKTKKTSSEGSFVNRAVNKVKGIFVKK